MVMCVLRVVSAEAAEENYIGISWRYRGLVTERGLPEELGFAEEHFYRFDENGDLVWLDTLHAWEREVADDSDYFILFDGESRNVPLDVPAQFINGELMIPLRLPFESIGLYVDWDADTRTVIIQ